MACFVTWLFGYGFSNTENHFLTELGLVKPEVSEIISVKYTRSLKRKDYKTIYVVNPRKLETGNELNIPFCSVHSDCVFTKNSY